MLILQYLFSTLKTEVLNKYHFRQSMLENYQKLAFKPHCSML